MSMTREEARIELQAMKDTFEEYEPGGSRCQMALKVAISALRPVSREQVERIWFREPYTRLETRYGEDGGMVYSAVNTCMACGHETPIGNFCHNCGVAQTAEGVEITMKRLEALKDGSTTD